MKTLSFVALACAAGFAFPAFGQDAKKAQPPVQAKPVAPAAPAAKQPEKPGIDEMAMYKELAKPTKEHEALQVLVGTWNAKITSFMGPAPETSTGTLVTTSIHGGRYVHREYTGSMGGETFTGSGDFGYNKLTNKYEATWLDSMGTGITVATGTHDAATKTYTMSSEMDMPGPDGKAVKMKEKEVLKVEGPDKNTMEMYMVGPDGKDKKVMEIVYTRGTGTLAPKVVEPPRTKPAPKTTDK
jgi:hypothetical protein